MKKKIELPSGYRWVVKNYSDDEGIVLSVTLVHSTFKPESWLDRVFRRDILSSYTELELDATEEECNHTLNQLKERVHMHFFNWS